MGILVGAALSVAGATMQGLFKNPMADPYILGISSGATVGAAPAFTMDMVSDYAIPVLAFLGASAAVFLVYNISKVGGKLPVDTLLLSGIAVSLFLSAITSLLMYASDENLHQIVFWLWGGLQNKCLCQAASCDEIPLCHHAIKESEEIIV